VHPQRKNVTTGTCQQLDLGRADALVLLERISDSFPVPQSPTTIHPERTVDASVQCWIPEWKEQTNGSSLGGRVGAIVVNQLQLRVNWMGSFHRSFKLRIRH
jgi:hypothetical protein